MCPIYLYLGALWGKQFLPKCLCTPPIATKNTVKVMNSFSCNVALNMEGITKRAFAESELLSGKVPNEHPQERSRYLSQKASSFFSVLGQKSLGSVSGITEK